MELFVGEIFFYRYLAQRWIDPVRTEDESGSYYEALFVNVFVVWGLQQGPR
jgi:hypothetical protein